MSTYPENKPTQNISNLSITSCVYLCRVLESSNPGNNIKEQSIVKRNKGKTKYAKI